MHESKFSVHAGPWESWGLVLCYSQLLQNNSLASSTSALDPVIFQEEPKHSEEAFRGYVNSLDWSVRMEHWSGILEWSTGVFKLIS